MEVESGLLSPALSHVEVAITPPEETSMITPLVLALTLAAGLPGPAPAFPVIACTTHTYEVKIRLGGKVSTTQVQASDAGHAKKLVQAQYGPSVTVLSVKKLN